MKNKGFTLAEMLISIGVIGVIAAITIPTLVNNYQKDVQVTSLKKFYNELDNALQRKMTDTNSDNLVQAGLTTQAQWNLFMENYFKYSKVCSGTTDGCFAPRSGYHKIDGSLLTESLFGNTQSYLLQSGAAVRPLSKNEGNDVNKKLANIVVDINGEKKPNIVGRDLFSLAVFSNGEIDDFDDNNKNLLPPLSEATRNALFNGRCKGGSGNFWGCFGKILNDNWQMKY
jgi:prepilin-type N-terminal cleavage/methylation domain-containing protein